MMWNERREKKVLKSDTRKKLPNSSNFQLSHFKCPLSFVPLTKEWQGKGIYFYDVMQIRIPPTFLIHSHLGSYRHKTSPIKCFYDVILNVGFFSLLFFE